MRYCVKCQLQYPNQMSRCEVCNIPLIDMPEQQVESDGAEKNMDLVELAGFANVSEAEMVQELLEKNGIEAVVQGEVDPIGIASRAEPTRLLVARKNLEDAEDIYQAYFSGTPAANAEADQDQ